MTKVCICQICTCGRHRCPHHPTSVISKDNKPCMLTEYANRYKPHAIDMRKPFKPEAQAQGNNGPLSDQTTNRVDYIKHPMEKPHVHQADPYAKPEGDVDHMTSYVKDYIKHPFEKTKPAKKDYVKKSPGKFEGEPTYKNDYRKWAINRQKPVMQDSGYRPSSQPFEGQPTYTKDYIRYSQAPRQSLRPMETARQSDQPFENTTGYKQEFIKHPLPPKEAREKPKYEANKQPLDGMSNYKRDYTAKQIKMNPSCKPEGGAYQSDAPFKGDTTQKTDYKQWPTERPFHHEHDPYTKPEGDFDFNTTHHLEFTKKPISKAASKAPIAAKKEPGRFDGDTNYKQDYRKWSLGGRPQIKQKEGYAAPDAPFEGTSNYTSDFIRHSGAPRRAIRPDDGARPSSQPFNGTTGYKDEYIKHALPDKFKREKQQYVRNTVPLDGLSSYKHDFVPKDGHKMPSCRPDQGAFQSDAPFAGDTTQRVDYKAFPVEKPHVHQHEAYSKPDGDFDHNTTTNLAYTPKPLATRRAIKPPSRKGQAGKFDGTTNYSEDFRKWGGDMRAKPSQRGDGYVAPQVPFEGSTNYHDDYIGHAGMPRASMRPTDGGYASNAPFEGDTMYRTDYTKKANPPCPALVIETGGRSGYVFHEQDTTGHKWYRPGSAAMKVPTPPRALSAQMSRPMAVSVA